MMKGTQTVIVTGATGLIGRALVAELLLRQFRVVALVRDVERARAKLPSAVELIRYSLGEGPGLEPSLEGALGVVNLAGETIFKPFTGRRRLRRVAQERINGAKQLASACARTRAPPLSFVQASSVGVYGFGPPEPDEVAEDAMPWPGEHSEGSLAWEAAAGGGSPTTRVVLLRLGYVLATDGGGFPYQLAEAAKGKVSYFRPGTQWLPWVHLADVVEVILAALQNEVWAGPYNVVAPEPATAAKFAAELARAAGAAPPRPAPRLFARLFMGAGAITVLNGRNVVPRRLLKQGFTFRYGELEAAFRNLMVPPGGRR